MRAYSKKVLPDFCFGSKGKMELEKRVFNKLKTKLEEFIQLNLIKYYLNKIKRNVKDSSLLIQEENYSQKAEKFIIFVEKLLSNLELCFIETKFARIGDECSEILLAGCDASERAKLTKVPLYYPRFYEFLYLCKNKKKLKP